MEDNIYQAKGFADRADYIVQLAEDYDVPVEDVWVLADLLGPTEDFDGLVVHVNDLSNPYA